MSVKVTRKSRMKELQKALGDISKAQARIGWFESAKYPDGTSVALVAAANEFGRGLTPPRPFIRPTIQANKEQWLELLSKGAKSVLKGDRSIESVLEVMSLRAVEQIKEKIGTLTSPPLAPSTIKARERNMKTGGKTRSASKPLVDTEVMIQQLTYSIKEK